MAVMLGEVTSEEVGKLNGHGGQRVSSILWRENQWKHGSHIQSHMDLQNTLLWIWRNFSH